MTPEVHFQKDLGLDSLDNVEIVMALEEEFKLEIPDKEADRIDSCNLAIEYIHNHPLASWFEHRVSHPEFHGKIKMTICFVYFTCSVFVWIDPRLGLRIIQVCLIRGALAEQALDFIMLQVQVITSFHLWGTTLIAQNFISHLDAQVSSCFLCVLGFYCALHCSFSGYFSLARDFSDACLFSSKS